MVGPAMSAKLRNAIEHAVAFCGGATIEVADLPRALLEQSASGAMAQPRSPARSTSEEAVDDSEPLTFRKRVCAYETQLIEAALSRSRGNVTKTAELLRIPVRTLTHKMRVYGLRERARD